MGLLLCHGFKKEAGPRLVPFEPSIVPHRPGDQRPVEMPEDRVERGGTEPPMVSDPAPQDGVVEPGDVPQAKVGSISLVQPTRGPPHGFQSFGADRRSEAHEQAVPFAVLHHPWPEGKAEEVELHIRVFAPLYENETRKPKQAP